MAKATPIKGSIQLKPCLQFQRLVHDLAVVSRTSCKLDIVPEKWLRALHPHP